jgi:MoaA/NifB/PqqE/SkfB family radical SAM enzyme
LILPHELTAQFGIQPGTQVVLDTDGDVLRVHRPASQLARLYVEVTNRCNLSCRMCVRTTWDEPYGNMGSGTFARILAGLNGVSPPPSLFFGGFGEPLLHPDVVDMVGQAKALGGQVELITNATLLTAEMSRGLIEAGLDVMWVSLDGATTESYDDVRPGAGLQGVLANVDAFRRLRRPAIRPLPHIGLAFVAMRSNIAELPGLLNLGRRVGASLYSVSNVLPYTAAMATQTMYGRALSQCGYPPTPYTPHVDLAKMDLNDATQPALLALLRREMDINYAGAALGDSSDRCPFIERGCAAVGWDGGLSPCLPLLHTHSAYQDDRRRTSRRWILGNVNQSALADLWHLPEHIAFRQRVQAYDFSPCTFCGGCEWAEANEEDCFGNTFPTCGGCLWAQGVIRCP